MRRCLILGEGSGQTSLDNLESHGEMIRRQTSKLATKAREWLRRAIFPSNLHSQRALSIFKCCSCRDPLRARYSVIAVSGILEMTLKFAFSLENHFCCFSKYRMGKLTLKISVLICMKLHISDE